MGSDDVGNASGDEVVHGLNNRSDIETDDDERSVGTLRSTEDPVRTLNNNRIEGLVVVAEAKTAVVLRISRFHLLSYSFL